MINLRKDSSSNPERKSTATLKPISALSIQRSERLRPACCIPPILSVAFGEDEEARSAGTMPNRSAVSRLRLDANARVLRLSATSSVAGNSVDPRCATIALGTKAPKRRAQHARTARLCALDQHLLDQPGTGPLAAAPSRTCWSDGQSSRASIRLCVRFEAREQKQKNADAATIPSGQPVR